MSDDMSDTGASPRPVKYKDDGTVDRHGWYPSPRLDGAKWALADDLDAANKKIEQITAEREWRPIATAPQNEIVIVIWYEPSSQMWKTRCAVFMGDNCYGFDSPYTVQYRPTHWMPLPASPTEKP